jgi:hypothetical protein
MGPSENPESYHFCDGISFESFLQHVETSKEKWDS